MRTLKVTRSPQRRRLARRADALAATVLMPRPLHRQMLAAARRLNWTQGEVLRTALAEWLARYAR